MLFVLIFNFASCNNATHNEVLNTNKIEDYNSDLFPLENFHVFKFEIPTNATVTSFYYYDDHQGYYTEAFLKIKLNSKSEIDLFINHVKDTLNEEFKNIPFAQENGTVHEENNPYNNSYVDLFIPTQNDSLSGYRQCKETHTGLFGKTTENIYLFDSIECISYSYSDLTVLLFSSKCLGISLDVYPRPCYYTYFNVPLDKEFQRHFRLPTLSMLK